MQKIITDDINAFLEVIPSDIRQSLIAGKDGELLEIVMDLGRFPEARFSGKELLLRKEEVTRNDIKYVIDRIGKFSGDNRAGIERTLHRISAIRNREGEIIGLTCRLGRAVFGTVKIIQDLVTQGKSVLLLGRPGIGKTTMLREVARVLADDFHKRVIVVDTSNEIAGDGDIPHPAIGHARRMQVPSPDMQHAVMIEAVENHMPQVIIVDEIGTSLEAEAARTIAERGVQLIGTAHGNSLENLMMNPTLSDLIGGIQSVTLSDEEARRRHTQKSILERKAPPTFNIVVEMQERDRVIVHPDVGEAVDAVLQNRKRDVELRYMDSEDNMKIQSMSTGAFNHKEEAEHEPESAKLSLYLFGVNRNRLEEAAREKRINLTVVNNLKDANILITTKHFYLRKPQTIRDAEKAGVPIYAVKSSNLSQLRQCLDNIYWRKKDRHAAKKINQANEENLYNIYAREESVNEGSEYIKNLQKAIADYSGRLLTGRTGEYKRK